MGPPFHGPPRWRTRCRSLPYKSNATRTATDQGRPCRRQDYTRPKSRHDPAEAQGGRRGIPGRKVTERSSPSRPTSRHAAPGGPRTQAESPAWTSKRIINEPTASALAYGLDKKHDEKIACTTWAAAPSTSRFRARRGRSSKSRRPTANPPGRRRLRNSASSNGSWRSSRRDEGIDLRNDRQALQRLKEAAEKAKIELSTTTTPRSTCRT